MKDRLHWFAMHGFLRGVAAIEMRRGDLQGRLFADPAIALDPVRFYDEVRSHGRLVRTRASYLTPDYQLAHELLRSDDFRVISVDEYLPTPIRWLERRTRDKYLHPLRSPSMLAVEPPDHTRYRKTVSTVFTPRAVAALSDRVEQTAINLLDRLVGQSGVVDVVWQYCWRLPIAVIGEILGVPNNDRQLLLEFGELGSTSLELGLSYRQYRRMQQGVAGINSWLEAHLRKLRSAPGEDLMSRLIRTAESGSADTYLDETELRTIAGLVLVAGFETAVNMLGNGLRMLLDTPEHLDTLRQRPELWPTAVEEILRLEPPVQLAARIARNDVEVAGTRIKRGELVVIYLAAANRDPSVFSDPHRFDIERPNAGRHLAFSGGRHFCPGAALARAEGEIGLRTFFDRFPNVRAAGAGIRRDTRVLRGWSTLPVTLDPVSSMASS